MIHTFISSQFPDNRQSTRILPAPERCSLFGRLFFYVFFFCFLFFFCCFFFFFFFFLLFIYSFIYLLARV